VLESVSSVLNFDVGVERIYFTQGAAPPAVEFLHLATGKIKTIAPLDKPLAWGLSISPDKKTLLFAVAEQDNADLMLVENFR